MNETISAVEKAAKAIASDWIVAQNLFVSFPKGGSRKLKSTQNARNLANSGSHSYPHLFQDTNSNNNAICYRFRFESRFFSCAQKGNLTELILETETLPSIKAVQNRCKSMSCAEIGGGVDKIKNSLCPG